MTLSQHNFIAGLLRSFFADRPKESVSDWCCRHLVFDEPKNSGPFNLIGTEYLREPLDAWADPSIRRQVLVQATQTRKTGGIMGGAAWTLVNNPSRLFWVMPTEGDVSTFSNTRWMPMLLKSPIYSALIPTGRKRHSFKTRLQVVGSSIVDFKWSNSPAALSSIPAPHVILDEVDKFEAGAGREANAVELAEQRTKSFPDPKIVATSTPSTEDGLIWQELLKTDLRRRFVPCPHCQKHVLLSWSKFFTTLKLEGCEAFVRWDKEAKLADGNWDLDRVERSARFECPHCGGHIQDAHKTLMDRKGEWRATKTAARGHRGWHLSSLYSPSSERNVGRLAVIFLQNKRSLFGLKGFVQNELAEPWSNQESRGDRVELVTGADAKPIAGAVKMLTVDVQLVAPYFWFIVREWNGDSRLLDFGPLDTWEEIRAKQLEHGIEDHHVGIDSGDDTDEVYKRCLAHGRLIHLGPGNLPIWKGWMPMKGSDERRRQSWKDPKTGQPRPFFLGRAALSHRRFQLGLLEFSGHFLKGILARLRQGKARIRWEVSDKVTDEYWKHLDAEYLKPKYNPMTHRVENIWVKRSKQWPNHLLDCELMSMAMALFHGKLPFDANTVKSEEPEKQSTKPEGQEPKE